MIMTLSISQQLDTEFTKYSRMLSLLSYSTLFWINPSVASSIFFNTSMIKSSFWFWMNLQPMVKRFPFYGIFHPFKQICPYLSWLWQQLSTEPVKPGCRQIPVRRQHSYSHASMPALQQNSQWTRDAIGIGRRGTGSFSILDHVRWKILTIQKQLIK